MEVIEVDVAIIGSGPSGQKAAIQSAKLGKSVVVIEKDPYPGGVSLNRGTIPSKTLREAILELTDFHSRSFYGQGYEIPEVSVNDLNFRLNRVLEGERALIEKQFTKNKVRLVHGKARFESPHQLIIVDRDYRLKFQIQAQHIMICSGSKPRNPIEVPFDEEVILDSSRLLSIGKLPKEMIVMGGGIIGSEYASFFAALGTKVTVIDKRDNLLPLLDVEIGTHLQKALADLGLTFLGNKQPKKIERIGERAHVTLTDDTVLEADILLYALGRVANVDGMNLESLGIQLNSRGHVPVNALFQTAVPHIYAMGDVIGGPSLASTSMEQGRLAARHACGVETHHFPTFFPIGIYTIPEISCCGYTEGQLKEMGFHYEVGRAYYYEIARSHISGDEVGLFKILFHCETLEILGIHIIGRGATEMIHIGQVAMSFHAHLDYFVDQVFNYPTYAEGYRIAALNGLNKIQHFQ